MTTLLASPLTRPRRMVVAGVCAGLAAHLGRPVGALRIVMVALTALGGAGLLLYLWLWVFVPVERGADEVTRRAPMGTILVSGGALAAIAAVTLANDGANPIAAIAWAIALLIAAVAWSLAFDRPDPERSSRYGVVIRSLGAALLAITGMLLLISRGARPDAMTAVFAVLMIVLGVGVIASPGLVRLWTELMAERATRVREEQRAEIAAHLHDSVLQTLALIQNRAGASSEVARIARAQERELRDWLFAGTAMVGDDLAVELREVAAAIELDYPVRIDIVTAGESTSTPSAALVAAAREGMVNAARHAGGDVSVYLETSASAVDVYIRDRGPGLDLAALPVDRLGIRESIIGRMTRAGGTATVGPGIGGVGTEVHLHLEVQQ